MTLTLQNIPRELDDALQAAAKREGKSVDQVAVEALQQVLGVLGPKRRDLSPLAGTWVDDPAFDQLMREQDQIDAEMWK